MAALTGFKKEMLLIEAACVKNEKHKRCLKGYPMCERDLTSIEFRVITHYELQT